MPSYKCLDDPKWWQENLADWVQAIAVYSGGGTVFTNGELALTERGLWFPNKGFHHITNAIQWTDLPEDWRTSLRVRPTPKVWLVAGPDTPIGAKVWARDKEWCWCRRHWAGDGRCFADGTTSWSSSLHHPPPYSWDYIVLADPDDPNTPPPEGWCPETSRGDHA